MPDPLIPPPEHEYTWQAPYVREVAILLVHHRENEAVLATCRSLLALPPSPWRYRVLIVDNGSGAESAAALQRDLPPLLATSPATPVPPVVVTLSREHSYAAAANRGLAEIREPYALLCEPGIKFSNTVPALLLEGLASVYQAALTGPQLLLPTAARWGLPGPLPSCFGEWTHEALARHLWLRMFSRPGDTNPQVPRLPGACLALHLARLQSIGRLDEAFADKMAITDWCARIRQASLQVIWVPAAEVILAPRSTLPATWPATQLAYEDCYRFFRKHEGRIWAAVLGVGHFIRLSLLVLIWLLPLIFSGFTTAMRHRWQTYAKLWYWHACLCPAARIHHAGNR
jgi:GT2 family glycosyltransferase